MMKALLSTLGLALALGLTACGPDPVSESHSGRLEAGDTTHPADGSFYDEYKFKAKEGWTISLAMQSGNLQPYLQLRMENQGDEGLVESAAEQAVATITHTAPRTTTYVVWANSMSAGETGDYQLTISAQPAQ